MSYTLKQTRRFARAYKKLPDNIATDVDSAADKVAADPNIGERKKGDLAELLVYKFRSQNSSIYWGTRSTREYTWSIWKPLGRMKTFIAT